MAFAMVSQEPPRQVRPPDGLDKQGVPVNTQPSVYSEIPPGVCPGV